MGGPRRQWVNKLEPDVRDSGLEEHGRKAPQIGVNGEVWLARV